MESIEKIKLLLENSGLQHVEFVNGFIEFDDPSCIYAAFDKILDIAWIVILVLTAFMLMGWAILYIKNGVKIDELFNNAKTVILIFCVLSVVKPIVNAIYGDNLFARGCPRKQASIETVTKLLELRNKNLPRGAEDELYEIFDMTDSGVIYPDSVSIED